MAQETMEIIRGIYDDWSQGEFAEGGYFDPQVHFIMGPGFPDAGTYIGPRRVLDYMRHFLEPWVHITIHDEEITEVGDSVVVAVRQEGVGRGSGAATELRYFHVWSFRGGKAIRFETFRERDEAFAAVGLT